ncbi:hypothetical protein CEXT_191421 [Caerostris extrusa]|uniref:Uncharacterized protein n=1 Tax=Caerostris extrusa TaxID=172846 RepID=A0AAV4Y9E3_CAEEX|nr:hypothetical protein CEXT_191421 [Caerostris extrusa]
MTRRLMEWSYNKKDTAYWRMILDNENLARQRQAQEVSNDTNQQKQTAILREGKPLGLKAAVNRTGAGQLKIQSTHNSYEEYASEIKYDNDPDGSIFALMEGDDPQLPHGVRRGPVSTARSISEPKSVKTWPGRGSAGSVCATNQQEQTAILGEEKPLGLKAAVNRTGAGQLMDV